MFFIHMKVLFFLFLFTCLTFCAFFVHVKSSCKKKERGLKFKTVLIISFILLLTCTPLNPAYGKLFYYLFLFMIICENLSLFMRTFFNLFSFMIICDNLFLFMIICDNLFLFMIICENLFESLLIYDHL